MQMRHVNHLRLGHDLASVRLKASHHNRIGIQRLRQLQRTGPRWLKTLRQSKMVQRIQPVFAAHRRKPRRSKTAAQNLRRRFANPLQARLSAMVVERKHQQNPPTPLSRSLQRPQTGLAQKPKKTTATTNTSVRAQALRLRTENNKITTR